MVRTSDQVLSFRGAKLGALSQPGSRHHYNNATTILLLRESRTSWGATMLFMLVSRTKKGTTREQLVERLSRQLQPETWELVRRGALSHILYKTGEEPGFFALLNASDLEEAKSLVEASRSRLDGFDVEMYPVKHFPHFD
jgi:hypothetical protein